MCTGEKIASDSDSSLTILQWQNIQVTENHFLVVVRFSQIKDAINNAAYRIPKIYILMFVNKYSLCYVYC